MIGTSRLFLLAAHRIERHELCLQMRGKDRPSVFGQVTSSKKLRTLCRGQQQAVAWGMRRTVRIGRSDTQCIDEIVSARRKQHGVPRSFARTAQVAGEPRVSSPVHRVCERIAGVRAVHDDRGRAEVQMRQQG
ncbi:hypothetical protein [Caballeronia sp. EK]|uniref:hypothetical protein n=1 Tax=Caballeronia sp. EK TaxID=2767469 RepID=UPI0021056FD1|nr:hypothetical protein [Caballeronia sp. EK]